MIMVGKAKPNQDAKFTTLPFCGKSLKGDAGCRTTWPVTAQPQVPPSARADPPPLSARSHSRVDLALQHQVRSGAGQRGDAPDAGRITHAQAHALAKAELLLPLSRGLWRRRVDLPVIWERSWEAGLVSERPRPVLGVEGVGGRGCVQVRKGLPSLGSQSGSTLRHHLAQPVS